MVAKKSEAVNEALKPVEDAATIGKESVEAAVKAGSVAAQKGYEQAVAMTKEQVEKASEALFKGYDQFNTLSKDNLEAVVASGTIVAKGVESLSKEVFALAQSSLESSMAVAKAFAGVRTLREAIDLQTELSRSQFDKLFADGAKIAELSVKVANEAVQPLQARVNVAFETLLKPPAVA